MEELMKGRRLTAVGAAKLLFHLPTLCRLLSRLLFDPRVMPVGKALFVGALLFIVSPFDIPNYVPVLGELSDVALGLLAARWFINACPPEVVTAHMGQIKGRLGWVQAPVADPVETTSQAW